MLQSELLPFNYNKMNICWKSIHPHAIQNVDLEKFTLTLHHLLTSGFSPVNGCRQNESKQLIKTSQYLFRTALNCFHLFDLCIFLSLDYHPDGTHSLQRIHWWASDGMLNFSKSVPITNKQKKTNLHISNFTALISMFIHNVSSINTFNSNI